MYYIYVEKKLTDSCVDGTYDTYSHVILSSHSLRLTRSLFFFHRRDISTSAAKSMLGFAKNQRFSVKELREAYFQAAKLCHPDAVRGEDANSSLLDRRVRAST